MNLRLDDVPIPLLPRVEQMILLLIRNQRAIELANDKPVEYGQVRFDFSPSSVEIYAGVKLGRRKTGR